MVLVKNDTDPSFDGMIAQYIEHIMNLRLGDENMAATGSGWRQLGVIVLNGTATVTTQQVFGELTWRPESANRSDSVAGRVFLGGSVALVIALFAACTPDYVYIRDGQSEGAVRQDYVNCTEQQFKVSNSTTECMQNEGYQALIVERPFPESTASFPGSPPPAP
jgi:hypothetical protein